MAGQREGDFKFEDAERGYNEGKREHGPRVDLGESRYGKENTQPPYSPSQGRGFASPEVKIRDEGHSIEGTPLDAGSPSPLAIKNINKTGGFVKLNLDQDDLGREMVPKDRTLASDKERLFKGEYSDAGIYVESKFRKILKELEERKKEDEDKRLEIGKGEKEFEREMKEARAAWTARQNRVYLLLQGVLCGIAIMHLYFLDSEDSDFLFLSSYTKRVLGIEYFFHIIVSLALIGAIYMLLHSKSQFDFLSRLVSPLAAEYKTKIYIYILLSVSYVIPWVLTMYLIKICLKMHFYAVYNVSASDISTFKNAALIRDACCICGWLVVVLALSIQASDPELEEEK